MDSQQPPVATARVNGLILKNELFQAAKNGFIGNLEELAEQESSMGRQVLPITSHRKDTLLHISAFYGHEELSRLLAQKFPYLLTYKNFIGDTPLHVAARAGKLLVVQALVAIQVTPNDHLTIDVNEDGNTPLHEAVIYKQEDVVEFLLQQKFRKHVSDVNEEGKSALYFAVESGNARIVENIIKASYGSSHNGDQIEKKYSAVDIPNLVGSSSTSQIGVNEHAHGGESVEIGVDKPVVDEGESALHATMTGIKAEQQQTRNPPTCEASRRLVQCFHTDLLFTSLITKKLTQIWKTEGNYLIDEVGNAQNMKNISKHSEATSTIQIGDVDQKRKGVLHVAITRKNKVILQLVADKVPVSLVEETHLLHLAASLGFLDGVEYLLKKFSLDVLRCDEDGFSPIHLACRHGHIPVIKVLLGQYPDAREFLTKKRQNILHVAAENGKDKVVRYILKFEWAEFLLNEKDEDGYTPLHLGTKNWHPKVVNTMTWDHRVDLQLVNKEGFTALEVAEKYTEEMAPFKTRLTWMALRSAGTPRAQMKDKETVKRLEAAKYEPYNMDYCKDRVNTLLLVSALVATVTFAAGFTMPGGTKNSGKNEGMASMTNKVRFQLFVIFDSIAIYSSIIVAVMLMWAQLGDLNLLLNALKMAQRLLGLSLMMMSLAFMTGVDLVVTELRWLSIVVLVVGSLSVVTLLALFVPLFLPYTSKFTLARYISYYPFRLLMIASER